MLFHSSHSKNVQPYFTRDMISHIKVFVFGFTHFRLLAVVDYIKYVKLIDAQSNVLFLSAFGVELDVNN